MDKKTLIIAQLIITCLMAGSMSGIMSLISMGPTAEWLAGWPKAFLVAWPIAFLLTQLTSWIGFRVAFRVRRILG